MDARLNSCRLCFVLTGLVVFLAGCPGPSQPPAPEIRRSALDVGPMQAAPAGGAGGFARTPLEAKDIEWVTGFHAEPTGANAAERGWHADLRLRNGTRLLVAAAGLAPISFPQGFGVSLGQILRDTPEGWRGAELVGSVGGSVADGERLHVSLDVAPPRTNEPEDAPPAMKRLYVLALPLLDETADMPAEPLAEWQLLTDPRAYWPVPAGARQVRTGKFSYLVPTDSTVHYVAAWREGPARSVRITDLADGKVLWQADAVGATIAPYSSANGFPLYREHEYEVEVTFENSGSTPVSGAAALYVYYRPPGDEAFGYPYPPPGDEAAP